MGRPSSYTEELGLQICASLADGKSLGAACSLAGVSPASVYLWLRKDPAFLENYERAREVQAEVLVGQVVDIADDSSGDVAFDEDGNPRQNSEFINRSRLRVDARKWYASKVLPKKYGDRLELAGDKENPLVVQHLTAAETIRRKRQERLNAKQE